MAAGKVKLTLMIDKRTNKAQMQSQVKFVGSNKANAATASEDGIVKKSYTYMVTNDLSVTPISLAASIARIQKGLLSSVSMR
ncbi:hypothetical protein Dsin_004132 [Dipteronia sinensis]|uniref:Uncharacterized protein n=1 Tax=Dipteronia sinensis TaxID=43782 RepID=A0AAE0EL01_9ROSI|nr:hypothetical protein Dsin_004132 [Dipteronia sinensis]